MLTSNLGPTFYALMFCLCILVTYLTVRRGWLRLPAAVSAGIVYTSLSFFLFALAKGNGVEQALVVGMFLGVIFTGATVIVAANFRLNALESGRETARETDRVIRGIEDDTAIKA